MSNNNNKSSLTITRELFIPQSLTQKEGKVTLLMRTEKCPSGCALLVYTPVATIRTSDPKDPLTVSRLSEMICQSCGDYNSEMLAIVEKNITDMTAELTSFL